MIASWDGLDSTWQPARTGTGPWDLDLGRLVAALRAPAVAAGLPDRRDDSGKRGYVWHCSARLAADDRVLSDGEWAGIARELLDGAGVAARDDPGGPRWFAVRHADDHIHIAVVLVRQDTGRRFWPYRDYSRLRETARAIERRLGLTETAVADGTAALSPSRGEIEKAARQGREPARVELARAVRDRRREHRRRGVHRRVGCRRVPGRAAAGPVRRSDRVQGRAKALDADLTVRVAARPDVA